LTGLGARVEQEIHALRIMHKSHARSFPAMPDHPFDQAIALTRIDDDLYAGRTSEDYWNSISPYGGITVATLLNAILLHPRRLGDRWR
jgi:hypothetical protein